MLIKAIVSEYQKIGVDSLSLSVDKANSALNLYKRLGFEITGETKSSWTMKTGIDIGTSRKENQGIKRSPAAPSS